MTVRGSSAPGGLSSAPDIHRSTFRPGKTFIYLAVAFVVCRFLTDVWLPALGLRQLADDYRSAVDIAAPYLILPICAIVSVQLRGIQWGPAILAVLASLVLDLFFFVKFIDAPAWTSLVAIGIAVAWGYLLWRRNQVQRPTLSRSVPSRLDRITIPALGVAYLGLTGLTLAVNQLFGHLRVFPNDVAPERLSSYDPILPTLVVLGIWAGLRWKDHVGFSSSPGSPVWMTQRDAAPTRRP